MTDRSERNTYFARAQTDADMAAGGRFAKEIATNVTGVPAVPTLPASSPWSRDPVPPEEPLGQDVDATTIPVGTPREIERSIRELGGPALEAPIAAVPAATVETDAGSPIRRRVR